MMLWQKIIHRWKRLFSKQPEVASSEKTSGWYLVGNVVQEHEFGESKEIRHGSKHFTPGTKVYCLPVQWGDGYEKAIVVGIARGPRRLITVVMSTKLITNWRAQVVYSPAILSHLGNGHDGFNQQWNSREEVQEYVDLLKKRENEDE